MRHRLLRCALALGALVTTVAATGIVTPATAASAATSTPSCTFNSVNFPIVTGVTDGNKIAINCTGLPALHPYLFLETSLLIGIDPKAAALLSGGVTPSAATLESALAALPEINPGSFAVAVSNLSGDLTENYKVPKTQPTDTNAGCPPDVVEYNSGLIGCAVAMIDLTTQTPVAAGSAVLEWAGYALLPPDPTVAFNTTLTKEGQQITVSDAPGATTYWWVATLGALEALLGGGTAPPETVSVEFSAKHQTFVSASQDITITPASYDGTTLTPPSISGSFTVPSSGVLGHHKVYVSLSMPLEGFPLQITAEAPLKVLK